MAEDTIITSLIDRDMQRVRPPLSWQLADLVQICSSSSSVRLQAAVIRQIYLFLKIRYNDDARLPLHLRSHLPLPVSGEYALSPIQYKPLLK